MYYIFVIVLFYLLFSFWYYYPEEFIRFLNRDLNNKATVSELTAVSLLQVYVII